MGLTSDNVDVSADADDMCLLTAVATAIDIARDTALAAATLLSVWFVWYIRSRLA